MLGFWLLPCCQLRRFAHLLGTAIVHVKYKCTCVYFQSLRLFAILVLLCNARICSQYCIYLQGLHLFAILYLSAVLAFVCEH